MKKARVFLFVTLGASLLGAQADTPYHLSAKVNLVDINAAVRDHHGRYVSGLKADDFAVFDNGKRVKLMHFSSNDAPVTIGLIVDNSGSMAAKRPEVITAGLDFARSSNPSDEFFVVNFNNRVYSALPAGVEFTDQRQMLHSAVFFGQPIGQTALYDAIDSGLKHLSHGHHEMRVLIVVSDGGDNVSRTSFSQLTRAIEESQATIYTVGLLDPNDPDLNQRVLHRIAAVSGGELFIPNQLTDVPAVFEQIAKDVRSRYLLAFNASTAKAGMHKLRVEVHDGGGRKLSVHARTSYWNPV